MVMLDASNNTPCEPSPCPRGHLCSVTNGEAECVAQSCEDLECDGNQRCVEIGEGAECQENVCETDLDCPADQPCDEGCQPDICLGGARRCDVNTVIECNPNGAEETAIYDCPEPESGFQSECVLGSDGTGCRCQDHGTVPSTSDV